MNFSQFKDELKAFLPEENLCLNCNMASYTSFKCGGEAALLLTADTKVQLIKSLELVKLYNIPYFILGNGSNVLFKDEGFKCLVIKLGKDFSKFFVEENIITSGAAVPLIKLSQIALQNSLKNLEFASGIPGSLGGAIYMNAGAYGGEMSQVLSSVTFLTKEGKIEILEQKDLQLSYRHSLFMENEGLILEAKLKLEKGNFKEIEQKISEFTAARKSKQPLSFPSAGSFFKRPKGFFAGKLIEDADLKGLRIGDAEVSTLHAGFIINRGKASANDVIDLMKVIQETVFNKFGVLLEPEVRIIGS